MTEKAIKVTSDLQITIQEIEVKNGSMLKGLQEIVGGCIEIVHPRRLERPLLMVVNDEGLLYGLPVNPVGSYLYGMDQHGHPILGDIAILQEGFRDGEPDVLGLSDEEAEDIARQLNEAFRPLKEARAHAVLS